MPKVVITGDNLPTVLHVLDKWTLRKDGKLTWKRYADAVADELKIEGGVSQNTLQRYDEITAAFTLKKDALRDDAEAGEVPNDETIELLLTEIETLKTQVARLKTMNADYKEAFVRWQYNLYQMQDIDMTKIDISSPECVLNHPLPKPVEEK